MHRPESEQLIAQMFDKVAPRYDFLNALLSLRQDQRWRKKMVEAMPKLPGGSLLDVATGTGDVLLAAHAQHPEYRVLRGVDISKEMLQLAAMKCRKLPASLVEFRPMSATQLDFKEGEFDCLSIAFGLRNVVDKEKALQEFFRVLKPQGVLLILEFFTPEQTLLAHLFQWYFQHVLPRIGALFSDKEAYSYLPASVQSFYRPKELAHSLSQVGFTQQKWQAFLFGSCRLIRAVKAGL